MKLSRIYYLLILSGVFSACTTTTEPENTNTLAGDQSLFTYWYRNFTPGQDTSLTEVVTLKRDSVDGRHITVGLHADGTRFDEFRLDSSGDLMLEEKEWCKELRLGIVTHSGDSSPSTTLPMKNDGYEFTGHFDFFTQYLGTESLMAAGRAVTCSRISVTMHLWAEATPEYDPHMDASTIRTFWYSPEIGYFARETVQTIDQGKQTAFAQHDLTSYVRR